MKKKETQPYLLLDGDLLGLAAAAFISAIVAAAGFFVQELDGFTVGIRVGLTFVVTYVVAFVFVRYLDKVREQLAAPEPAAVDAEQDAASLTEHPGEGK